MVPGKGGPALASGPALDPHVCVTPRKESAHVQRSAGLCRGALSHGIPRALPACDALASRRRWGAAVEPEVKDAPNQTKPAAVAAPAAAAAAAAPPQPCEAVLRAVAQRSVAVCGVAARQLLGALQGRQQHSNRGV